MDRANVRRVSVAGLVVSLTGAGLLYFSEINDAMADPPVCKNGEACPLWDPDVQQFYTGVCGPYVPGTCGCGGEDSNGFRWVGWNYGAPSCVLS